ncbi:DUF1990 domain-containing protein [soil metagenome]
MDAGSLWQTPVTYGAIGGTQAPDLMMYPPKGFRPVERRIRIGHGQLRWEHAWLETMSWGIQKRSGIKVNALEAPTEVTTGTYVPVAFDTDGTPVQPAGTSVSGEAVFGPDGSPLLRPGDTAIMHVPLFPPPVPARVVYVIDEPLRKGFAYGTLPGHPESGEEAFIVEFRDDDSVWLTIRAFSRPSSWIFWVGYPIVRLMQEIYTARYERALSGPIEGENP